MAAASKKLGATTASETLLGALERFVSKAELGYTNQSTEEFNPEPVRAPSNSGNATPSSGMSRPGTPDHSESKCCAENQRLKEEIEQWKQGHKIVLDNWMALCLERATQVRAKADQPIVQNTPVDMNLNTPQTTSPDQAFRAQIQQYCQTMKDLAELRRNADIAFGRTL
jgi:hypothetical protein